MVATEKLSAWAKENEDGPLHGAFEPDENLAVGGGVRWIQTYSDDAQTRKGSFFRMSSDIEGGLRLGKGVFKQARVWVASRVGIEGGPDKSPTGERIKHRTVSPTHYMQWEPSEGIYVRAGRFATRFGLMIPDHSASVRTGTGLSPGAETRQIEATFTTKVLDLTFSRFIASRDRNLHGLWIDTAESRDENGYAAHASFFLVEKYRIGVQALRGTNTDMVRTVRGIHAALPLSSAWTLLHETDWQSHQSKKSHLTWTKLICDAFPGLSPYTWIEANRPDMATSRGRRDGVGAGIAIKPRPHFNLDFASGLALDREKYTYALNGRVIAHYWF